MFGFLSMSLSVIVISAGAGQFLEISGLTSLLCESSLTIAPSDRHPHRYLELSARALSVSDSSITVSNRSTMPRLRVAVAVSRRKL